MWLVEVLDTTSASIFKQKKFGVGALAFMKSKKKT